LRIQPGVVLPHRFRYEPLLQLNRPREAAEALDAYLKGTENPPRDVLPRLLEARGNLHAQMGELGAALDAYTSVLRLNPRHTRARGLRGWIYLEMNAARLGLEDFEACLRAEPGNADYLTGRASAQVRLRKRQEALADAAAAEKQGPLAPLQRFYLGCVYAQAAAQLGAEARSAQEPQPLLQFQAAYEDKALDCLYRAIQEMPEERRDRFWRDQVQKDPSLTAIRSKALYLQIEARFGRKEQ
jgi:tetratricopeptide (TPR) repeat protein